MNGSKQRPLSIAVQSADELAIVCLDGELDTCACPRVLAELENVRARGLHRVVLDLCRVRFISSTALGLLLESSQALAAEGGGLAIAHPTGFCRKILERVGLSRLVAIFESTEEAAAHLRASRGDGSAGPS